MLGGERILDSESSLSAGRSGEALGPQDAVNRAAAAVAAAASKGADYRCPACSKALASYAQLREHYAASHADAIAPESIMMLVNGAPTELLVEAHWTLHDALQFKLGLTGAKHMCNRGVCGSCTVILDGRAVLSCTTLAVECDGARLQTVEGIAADPKWRPLIDSYCKWDAMQCGYCTPGFLVSAKALLDANPNPTEDEILEALAGNICICGTYPRHVQAILEAAAVMAGEGANA
jgi:xanthine dehydrogenase YagT iron-sulfur-binding subunit